MFSKFLFQKPKRFTDQVVANILQVLNDYLNVILLSPWQPFAFITKASSGAHVLHIRSARNRRIRMCCWGCSFAGTLTLPYPPYGHGEESKQPRESRGSDPSGVTWQGYLRPVDVTRALNTIYYCNQPPLNKDSTVLEKFTSRQMSFGTCSIRSMAVAVTLFLSGHAWHFCLM